MAIVVSDHAGWIVEKATLVSEGATREAQVQKQPAIIDFEKLHLHGIQVLELEQKWGRHSIYRVPNQIRKLNPEVYEPKLVSIGPYHYGKPHLKAMEEHKHRALQMFLGRTKQSVEECMEALREVVDVLRDSYAQLEEEWVQDEDRFLQLMLLDASFIYEIHYLQNTGHDLGYAAYDPVFSKSGLLHAGLHLQDDLLMLENQLPYPALNSIVPITTQVQVRSGALFILCSFASTSSVKIKN